MASQRVSAEHAGYWTGFPISCPTVTDPICVPKVKGGSIPPDDAPVKVRKPYTITKQRERWTEDEHQNFLDALKLHGRAWRRIEEHIGTKTAVQIRSHAQKFFCKLEREASLAGLSRTAGSGGIAIPPPRPKRKPTHPYPRKASGAFSSSPSFEEENKSPPAVCSAFTPLGSNTRTALSERPPKERETFNSSLRLFGQTMVPCEDTVGRDGYQTEVSHLPVMESTGSPRSQVSGEVDQAFAPPITSYTPSVVQNKSVPVACRQPQADMDISSSKESVGSKFLDVESRLESWQHPSYSLLCHHLASIPASFWQGLVPSSLPHGYAMHGNANAMAAFTATYYAMTSAWQAAVQGAMASSSSQEANTSIVYNPIAILAPARKPQPPHGDGDELSKDEQKDDGRNCNEFDGTSLYGEDSTAKCCSTITADTSRFSCYESNDEGTPAKKRHRRSGNDTSVASNNSHIRKADSRFLLHEGSEIEISARSSDSSTRPTIVREKSSGVEFPGESPLCKLNSVSGRAMEQPLDFIVQACELYSLTEIDEEKEPTKWGGGSSHGVIDIMSSSTAPTLRRSSSAASSKGSVKMGHQDTLEDGENFVMKKASSILKAQYSGAGFVPYKRSASFESSNKPED